MRPTSGGRVDRQLWLPNHAARRASASCTYAWPHQSSHSRPPGVCPGGGSSGRRLYRLVCKDPPGHPMATCAVSGVLGGHKAPLVQQGGCQGLQDRLHAGPMRHMLAVNKPACMRLHIHTCAHTHTRSLRTGPVRHAYKFVQMRTHAAHAHTCTLLHTLVRTHAHKVHAHTSKHYWRLRADFWRALPHCGSGS